jgi:hypothetical protein
MASEAKYFHRIFGAYFVILVTNESCDGLTYLHGDQAALFSIPFRLLTRNVGHKVGEGQSVIWNILNSKDKKKGIT